VSSHVIPEHFTQSNGTQFFTTSTFQIPFPGRNMSSQDRKSSKNLNTSTYSTTRQCFIFCAQCSYFLLIYSYSSVRFGPTIRSLSETITRFGRGFKLAPDARCVLMWSAPNSFTDALTTIDESDITPRASGAEREDQLVSRSVCPRVSNDPKSDL
jgi:hypothetical protein